MLRSDAIDSVASAPAIRIKPIVRLGLILLGVLVLIAFQDTDAHAAHASPSASKPE